MDRWASSIQITPELLRLITEIDAFRTRWVLANQLAPERLRSLRRVATIESIASSTRIEGSTLSNSDVEHLLANVEMTSLANRDEREVAGYADAFDLILSTSELMPFTQSSIRELHRVMMGRSDHDLWHRGAYKTVSNAVAAFDSHGREIGRVFETSSPADTPRLMQELLDWTVYELGRGELHSLLVIGVFVAVFLEIHPFQDGNGRLSRLLTLHLLLTNGYTYAPYSSIESIIEESKSGYYRALRSTQQTVRTDDPQWGSWLTYFIRVLHRQMTRLETKVDQISGTYQASIDDRIIAVVTEQGTASIGEIHDATGINRNTLKAHLRALVAANRLQQYGRGRGVRYGR